RSMYTTNLTHEPAIYLIQTGKMAPGRPAVGSWVVYGLGSENQNLPAYVVLDDPKGLPVNGVENWQAGFLPPTFQGTRFRSTGSFGRRCLIARRLVERGVRFVQLCLNAQVWDNHTALATDLKAACDRTDRPVAGLLRDLKQRGLLDETLVVWGGEFGRLPIA